MPKEILIADPDKMVQEELERVFEATNCNIHFMNNDEEALLWVRLFKPDLILGGKDLCQAIRLDNELKDIPFIIVVDKSEDLSEPERTFLRADGVITKPISKDKVLSLATQLFESLPKGVGEKVASEGDLGWKSFADDRKERIETKAEFSLDAIGEAEEEEEIIELVDVVEEPESKVGIDLFPSQQRVELTEEIPAIEPLGKEGVEEFPPSIPKSADRQIGFEEFEAALKGSMVSEGVEEEVQPISIEEMKRIAQEAVISEKETTADLELQELPEEEIPEFTVEELDEEDLSVLEISGEVEPEIIEEEEISELLGEEIQPQEQALEELVRMEAIPPEEQEKLLPSEELVPIEPMGEMILPQEEALEEAIRLEEIPPLKEEIIPIEVSAPVEPLVEAILPPEQALEEVARLEALPSYPEMGPMEEVKEAELPIPEVVAAPEIPLAEISPPVMRLDRKIEEIIARGVQEMMQDFMSKVIPELTTQMINVTMERIEKMVREVVPDLAEKAIQEEIARLQKGDKE